MENFTSLPGVRGRLNAFIDIPEAPVPNSETGPLSGLTLAVKDIFDVVGYKTGVGNPVNYADASPAKFTASSVQALLDTGAKFVGKVQTEEHAWCVSGLSTHLPPCINSAAPDRTVGGSSSGSVAAVAGGLADIAVGSDTLGSIRIPANNCGLVGLRTTLGRIPLDGAFIAAAGSDTFGWFAKDVKTYEKVGDILLGPTRKFDVENFDMSKIKLWTIPDFEKVLFGVDEKQEYAKIKAILEKCFQTIENRPSFKYTLEELGQMITIIRSYEQWQVHGSWFLKNGHSMVKPLQERYEFASRITKEEYEKNCKKRDDFKNELSGILEENRFLVLPTAPTCAPLRTTTMDELKDYRTETVKLLSLASLTGFPQITIPLGKVYGAPYGISILGKAYTDEILIKLAKIVLSHG